MKKKKHLLINRDRYVECYCLHIGKMCGVDGEVIIVVYYHKGKSDKIEINCY